MPFDLLQTVRVAAPTMLAAFLFTTPPAVRAGVVYDNLASSQDGSDPLYGYGPLADSFTTGAAVPVVLSSVQALLRNGSTSVVGDFTLSLRADADNAPGAELLSLGSRSSADVSTSSFGAYRFAPVTSFVLAANTTYWIEMLASTPDAIEWSWSNDLTAPGVAGQSSFSAALGSSANSVFGPYQMAVEVALVPEPGTVALLFTGLALGMTMTTRRRRRDR